MNCAGPGADQLVRLDVAAVENIERGDEFIAEVVLTAADTGERRGRAQHRSVAADLAVIGLDTPDRGDGIAVDAIGFFRSIESATIFFQERAASCDAVVID